MPKARRKPKKKAASSSSLSDGGEKSITTGVANLSLSPLNDASPLLLSSAAPTDGKLPFKLPYIGPISLIQQHQSVVHGRGLIATRDVSAGECLFVIPAVAAAPIDQVYNRYLQEDEEEDYDDIDDDIETNNNDASFVNKDGPYLESIAEDVLIEQIQSLLDLDTEAAAVGQENLSHAKSLLHAFVSQMSSDEVPSTATNNEELMKILLLDSTANIDTDKQVLDRETILSIIRRNAFGPDFHNYDAIATCWNTTPDGKKCYNRLLGAYPLSAMINHSCSPNAVRVFGRIPKIGSNDPSRPDLTDKIQGNEVMIVHANKLIAKGTEISWSYIPPAIPLTERREALSSKYGFTCNCLRCIQEEKALKANPLTTLGDYIPGNEISMRGMIQTIEQNPSSNEIRVSFAPLYLEYFNTALSQHSDIDKINDILKLATRLHFSFVACNNACTEHLSILHMCYDLAGVLHSHALQHQSEGAMTQVRFWTEQLKKAVMTRYGNLGEDLENVRALMKHSKLVLRKKDGWYSVTDKFI